MDAVKAMGAAVETVGQALDQTLNRVTKRVLTPAQLATLERTFNLFDSEQKGSLSLKQLVEVLKTLDAVAETEEEVRELLKSVGRGHLESVTFDDVKELVNNVDLHMYQNGRFYVGLSLFEAEALRGVIHMRRKQAILKVGGWVGGCADCGCVYVCGSSTNSLC